MLGRGAKTKAEHARRFGIDYTHYFTLRSGESLPSLKTAVRMTREAGTTVEALFGLERAA